MKNLLALLLGLVLTMTLLIVSFDFPLFEPMPTIAPPVPVDTQPGTAAPTDPTSTDPEPTLPSAPATIPTTEISLSVNQQPISFRQSF